MSDIGDPREQEWPLLTGAQALTQRLEARGYRWAFAYPGTSELHLCSVLAAGASPRLIPAWGDKEAVFMAAGANLPGGPIAVSILHAARGLTNALGAIADTRRSEIPALHIVGMASRSSQPFLPPHAEPDLLPIGGRLAAHAFDCSTLTGFDPREFLSIVDAALEAVEQIPAGPVLLGVPQDLLENAFVPGVMSLARSCPSLTGQEPDTAAAAEILAASQAPVIIADDYLLTRSRFGEAALGALAQHIGAPVFQVAYRRGPMLFPYIDQDAVPTFVGPYDPSDPGHRGIFESADLVLTIEDRNMYPRVVGRMPACRKIAITSNASATRKNGYLTVGDHVIEGDPAAILSQLIRHVPSRKSPVPPRQRSTTAGCDAARGLVDALAALLQTTETSWLVDDSQSLGGLVARNIHRLPASTRVFGSHGGFVGSGLPIANGLAIATGHPVVCLLGDHGYLNSVQALAATAAQSPALLIIVCNNGGSHSLVQESLSRQENAVDHHLREASYTAIASGYGIAVYSIEWPGCDANQRDHDLAMSALRYCGQRVSQRAHPMLVEIRTPPSDADFWHNVWRTAGYE